MSKTNFQKKLREGQRIISLKGRTSRGNVYEINEYEPSPEVKERIKQILANVEKVADTKMYKLNNQESKILERYREKRSDIVVKDRETLLKKYIDSTRDKKVCGPDLDEPSWLGLSELEDEVLEGTDGISLTSTMIASFEDPQAILTPEEMKFGVDASLYANVYTVPEYIEVVKQLPEDYLYDYVTRFGNKVQLLDKLKHQSVSIKMPFDATRTNPTNTFLMACSLLLSLPSEWRIDVVDKTVVSSYMFREGNVPILDSNALIDVLLKKRSDIDIRRINTISETGLTKRSKNFTFGVYTKESNTLNAIIGLDRSSSRGGGDGLESLRIYYESYWSPVNELIQEITSECVTLVMQEPVVSKSNKTYWINIVGSNNQGYTLSQIECDITDQNAYKESTLHYGHKFPEYDKAMKDRLKDKSGTGSNLFMMYGEPGTGKTFYLKNLMGQLAKEVTFIFIPPSMVNAITDPSFFSWLTVQVRNMKEDGQSVVLIIEEAEQLLISRDEGNMSPGVSALLNLGDGIISDIMNVKIITTFNCDINKIDKALLRPGRLSIKKKFGYLTKKQVIDLLKSKDVDVDDLDIRKSFGLINKSEHFKMTIAEFYDKFNDSVNQLVYDDDYDYDFEEEGDADSYKVNKEKETIL